MIYLASPYTSVMQGPEAQRQQQRRYELVLEFTTHIIATGGPVVFSPIVYGHVLAEHGGLPPEVSYWSTMNMDFLRRSEALFVFMLSGWQQSKGVKLEIEVAKVLGIPIEYYHEDHTRQGDGFKFGVLNG